MLQSMGSQKVGHYQVSEQQQNRYIYLSASKNKDISHIVINIPQSFQFCIHQSPYCFGQLDMGLPCPEISS